MIQGDPDRLQQVVWNLLANGVKLTPEGGSVRISLARRGRRAVITVSDTGRGIDPGFLRAELSERRGTDRGRVSENGMECPPQLYRLRVLVVDDEPDARELLLALLEDCGVQVEAVASVREALAAFPRLQPEVLISDIAMPGEDGYDLIRQVRALPAGAGG